MAANAAPFSPLTDVTRDRRDEQAGRQILRWMAVFITVGYLAYGLMTAAGVAEAMTVTDTWWTVVAVPLVFGTGIALGPISWWGSVRTIRIAAAVAAGGYMLAVGLWWLAWDGSELDSVSGIWFSLFPGLAAIAAALAFRAIYAFGYLAVACAMSVTISILARPAQRSGPLAAEIAWSITFSLVFVAAAVMAIRTASILDSTRTRAFEATANAASARARAAERSRFDALTHDDVMSTLLLGSRNGESPELAQSARAAIAAVERAATGQGLAWVSAYDTVGQVRAAVALVAPSQAVVVPETDATATFPNTAVSVVAAAAGEAVRNSQRHAGAGATTSVTVTADRTGVMVEVIDDGVGFDPQAVPASRLGIAVSIRGRMSKLDGGVADIDSRPGSGTRVLVGWLR